MGLIEIRNGIGGGIFAAEVDMNTTTNSLTNFLHFKNVSIRVVTMFRYFLDPPLAQIAALKADETDIQRLGKMTDEEVANENNGDPKGIGFHRDIARFSENPLTILLMDFIENLLADIKVKLQPGADFYQEVARDHYKILDAFKKRDGAAARKAMAEHIICVGDHLAKLGRVASFSAAELEAADGQFYMSAMKNPFLEEYRSAFEEAAAVLRKNEKGLLRARREYVTEMILEPSRDFSPASFSPDRSGAAENAPRAVLEKAAAMETNAVRFYRLAAEKMRALPEVSPLLTKVGRSRAGNQVRWETLLGKS